MNCGDMTPKPDGTQRETGPASPGAPALPEGGNARCFILSFRPDDVGWMHWGAYPRRSSSVSGWQLHVDESDATVKPVREERGARLMGAGRDTRARRNARDPLGGPSQCPPPHAVRRADADAAGDAHSLQRRTRVGRVLLVSAPPTRACGNRGGGRPLTSATSCRSRGHPAAPSPSASIGCRRSPRRYRACGLPARSRWLRRRLPTFSCDTA